MSLPLRALARPFTPTALSPGRRRDTRKNLLEDGEGKESGKKVGACRRAIPRDNVVPVLETGVLVRA